MASKDIRIRTGKRLAEVETTDYAMGVMLADALDSREAIIVDTMKPLYDKAAVTRLCGPDVAPVRSALNISMLWEQCTGVASELQLRFWSSCRQLPRIAVCALQEEDADCIHWCKFFAKEFEVLRNWETEAAKGSLPHHKVVAKLTWRLEPLPRVFY